MAIMQWYEDPLRTRLTDPMRIALTTKLVKFFDNILVQGLNLLGSEFFPLLIALRNCGTLHYMQLSISGTYSILLVVVEQQISLPYSGAREMPFLLMRGYRSVTMQCWEGRRFNGIKMFPGLPNVLEHWHSTDKFSDKTIGWSTEFHEEEEYDEDEHIQLDVTVVTREKMGNCKTGSCDEDCLYAKLLQYSRQIAIQPLFQKAL